MPSNISEIPAEITKEDIAPLAALRGEIVAVPIFIDRFKHPAGYARYLGFVGVLDRTGRCFGHHRIEALTEPEDITPGFDGLPGMIPAASPITEESEVPDGSDG